MPSHLYSFSFAPNPEWSRTFSPQPEIRAYLRDCAERYGVMAHIRFGHELLDASWDDDARVQERMRGTVWTEGGCASWYLDAEGRNTTLWPSFTWPFRERTRRLEPAHYELRAARPQRVPVAG